MSPGEVQTLILKLHHFEEVVTEKTNRLERHLEKFEASLAQLEDDMWPRLGSLAAEIATARTEAIIKDQRIDDRFADVHRRLDGVHKRLDGIQGVTDTSQQRALDDAQAELALARSELRQLEHTERTQAHDWRKSAAIAVLAAILSIAATLALKGI